MSFPKYLEYKDSGVEWLGEVPAHWDLKRLRFIALLEAGQSPPAHEVHEGTEGLPFLQGNADFGLVNPSPRQSCACAPKRAVPGDILFSVRAPVGAMNFADQSYGIGRGLCAIHPLEVDRNYLFYLVWATREGLHAVATGSTYEAISASQLGDHLGLAPPESEQGKIAAFLDHEIARIDALVEEQQRLIELLKEKRQAVISHAVTKGLDPDVPMKDSGVEWLGEVPAHWEILGSKRFLRLVAEPAPKNNTLELLSVYTDIGVRPRKELEQKGNKASTTDGYWLVKKGDLVVNKLLAWMGAVGFSAYEGVTSPAYDILRPTRDMEPKFYHYLFRSRRAQQEFKRWSRGIMDMRLRLYFDELGRILVPFPPPEEQAKIVLYIETLENQYDALADAASEQIKLLMERRSALISAAVTGKIDVRGWKPSAGSSATSVTKQTEAV